MLNPAIQRVLKSSDLPRLPAVVAQLIDLLGDPKAEVKTIAETLSKDADLTVNVLRMVNSSYYGLTNRVTTIEQAVKLLGMKKVKSITIGCALTGSLTSRTIPDCDPMAFWRHSLFASACARLFAKEAGSPHAEEAFVMGLLVNIGAVAMAMTMQGQYTSLLHDGCPGMAELAERERKKFNADHAVVSAAMVESWNLPEILYVPLRHTFEPDSAPEEFRNLAAVLCVASDAADAISAMQLGDIDRFITDSNTFCDNAGKRLNLDWQSADRLLADAAASAEDVAELLQIDAGPMPDLDKLSEQFNLAVQPNQAA